MRIDRLDLIAYGGFTDKTLDLSAGSAGLHLIYGDNEAGKSTALRAIIAWLFGIPARTPDNYRHDYAQLRIGGQLRLQNGHTLAFRRRKGNKGALLAADGVETLDDAVLGPFLPSGLDEALFTRLYGIDHTRLEAGGRELLEQSGDLGQALFSAALGVASARTTLNGLQQEAEALFKPRASTRPVNQSAVAFRNARKRVRELSLPVREWDALREQLAATLEQITAVEADISAHSREKSRLQRLQRIRGPLQERQAILQQLAAQETVRLLAEDFPEQCRMAQSRLQQAEEAGRKAQLHLDNQQAEIQALNVPEELLARELEILALHKALGAIEKSLLDRPQQDGQRRLLRNEATQLLKATHPELRLDDAAATLRPLLKKKHRIAALARQYSQLSERRESSARMLKEAETDRRQLQAQAPETPATPPDLPALKAAVAAARRAGDLDALLAQAHQQAAERQLEVDSRFQRLGRFQGTLESLTQIALPVPATLDRFEQHWHTLAQQLREQAHRQQELGDEQVQAQQELAALLYGHDVPTLEQLRTARTRRDQLWQAIRRHYLDQAASVQAETAEAPPDAARYEQQLEEADHLSDRLRLEADQVARRSTLEARIRMLGERLETAQQRLDQGRQEQQSLQRDWEAEWWPLGIRPAEPPVMKQWLARVDSLLAGVREARLAQAQVTHLAADHTAHRQTLAVQLADGNPAAEKNTPQADLPSLSTLLAACEQGIEQEEQRRNRQVQWQQACDEASERIDRQQDSLATIEAHLATWGEEWQQAIAGLGLGTQAHPEEALETLEQLALFFEKYDASEEKRRRLWGMDKDRDEFGEQVFAFAAGIGCDCTGQPPERIAEQLYQGLSQAREARAKLEKMRDAEKVTREALHEADITRQAAQQRLAELQALAQVSDEAGLQQAGEQSGARRTLQRQLEALEQELRRNGDGLTLAALEQEAAVVDLDTAAAALEPVDGVLDALYRQRDSLRDQRQTLQNRMEAQAGGAAAADAAEEAEQHLASLSAGAEQYLRLKIAALMLGQRIEAYRQQNQAPVLSRAGGLFACLTLDAYAGLRDELGTDDKPVLLGLRPDNTEVPVDCMSEGTRAQLYLALRLATLEQQFRTGEPMPFIVDDILISFDDRRTRAGLEVLAELATRTQVLLFTHHRRVLELADGLDAVAGVFAHELQGQ